MRGKEERWTGREGWILATEDEREGGLWQETRLAGLVEASQGAVGASKLIIKYDQNGRIGRLAFGENWKRMARHRPAAGAG